MLLDRLAGHTGALTVSATVPGDTAPGRDSTVATTLRNLLDRARDELGRREDVDRDEREHLLASLPEALARADDLPIGSGLWLAVSPDVGVTAVPLAGR